MKQILSLLLLLICSTIVAADFKYTYKGKTLTYTVVDEESRTCKLKDGHYYGTSGNQVSGKLVIPSKVKYGRYYYTVTELGAYTFYGCSKLTSVTIPSSVTTIGKCAFAGCKRLTKVIIGRAVQSIGSYAFSNCNKIKKIIAYPRQAPKAENQNTFDTDVYSQAILIYGNEKEADESYGSYNNIWWKFANYYTRNLSE